MLDRIKEMLFKAQKLIKFSLNLFLKKQAKVNKIPARTSSKNRRNKHGFPEFH